MMDPLVTQKGIHAAILGASGRMSRAVIDLFIEIEETAASDSTSLVPIKIIAGIEHPDHIQPIQNKSPNTLPLFASLNELYEWGMETPHKPKIDVLIDFSHPNATLQALQEHLKYRSRYPFQAWVIGTTGFSPEQETLIANISKELVIVRSGNFSKGIFVLMKLLQLATQLMGADCDLEIVETHHRHKKDAPSGTAKMLAATLALANKISLADHVSYGRNGPNAKRRPQEIGIAAVRGGGAIGDHAVHFLAEHERLILSHTAFSRASFASGVPAATAFAYQKARAHQAGLYSIADVFSVT